MSDNERQQRLAERIWEDEALRGELDDAAATALLTWASAQVEAVAGDPARSDEAVDADVQAIRAAVRSVARSGEADPQRLVALAQAALSPTLAAPASSPPLPIVAPLAATEQREPPGRPAPWQQTPRRRFIRPGRRRRRG